MKNLPNSNELKLDVAIGQTLCFGWSDVEQGDSTTLNAHARELIEEFHVGSVILMGRNVERFDTVASTISELQSNSPIPLFVAIDQEGGSVNRFYAKNSPFHEFPGNMALGAIQEDCQSDEPAVWAKLQGQAQAYELRCVGVNWNFAPVADVSNNPANPIIGIRSYGEDPQRVAELAVAASKGLQNGNVLACAKHFPGHGDTDTDSHLALPHISGDRNRLDSIELVPFKALIEAGVGAIMSTHILFPALDPVNPATMSHSILTKLLRIELGFQGIIITDCMEMDAIRKGVGTAQGAVEALKAGADVVLVCHTLELQREVVAAIRDAVASGYLLESRVREAAARVLNTKLRIGTAVPYELTSSAAEVTERTIAEKSITLIRNGDILPISTPEMKDAVIISDHYSAHAFAIELHSRFRSAKVISLREADCIELKPNTVIIVFTAPHEAFVESAIDQKLQLQVARRIFEKYPDQSILLPLREPYIIGDLPEAKTVICGYGYRNCTLRALAGAICGEFQATGKLPVTIDLPTISKSLPNPKQH